MHVLPRIRCLSHLFKALYYVGIATALAGSPKNLLALFHRAVSGQSRARVEREWSWRVVDLSPEANRLLQELKERLGLRQTVLIALCDSASVQRVSRLYINPAVDDKAPSFIGLSPTELSKTFDVEHPAHLTYRLLLLTRLAQVKQGDTSKKADRLYCALFAASLAALHLTELEGRHLLGLAVGQWTGQLGAARLQRGAIQCAQLRAARALSPAELAEFMSLHFAGDPSNSAFQSANSSWREVLVPYDQIALGKQVWYLDETELAELLLAKREESAACQLARASSIDLAAAKKGQLQQIRDPLCPARETGGDLSPRSSYEWVHSPKEVVTAGDELSAWAEVSDEDLLSSRP